MNSQPGPAAQGPAPASKHRWRRALREPVTGRALRVWVTLIAIWAAVDLVGAGLAAGLYLAGAR